MAHPSKFVSVNLNKSYGRPTSSSSSSNARTTARSGPHPHPATGAASRTGGGGMVVLSRPSSTLHKSSAPKLSVPPPLNLPSLRKENEKFDSGAAGSSARPGSSGIGSGSGTGSVGWTKPAPFLAEKPAQSAPSSGSGGAGAYMPPAARTPSAPAPTVDKAVFLRGEDFPSLKAATFAAPGPKQQREEREKPELRSPLPMRPQMRSSRLVSSSVTDEAGSDQTQKQPVQEKYSMGPLPVVKLPHKSDWADDERDTGLSFPERGFSRGDDDKDSYGMNKEYWRGPPPPSPPQAAYDRDRFRSKPHDGVNNGIQDSRYSRNQNGRNVSGESFSGRNGRFDDTYNSRSRGDSGMNNTTAKAPFSAANKGISVNDPILNFGRDKRNSNSGKEYLGNTGFDRTDPFSDDPITDVNIKVFKKKKEVLEETDFNDPVRASFEAELERVQRIQEQERQRVMDEQARVSEFARREQEERERLVREEEERRRMIEEEAREAVWRAEQEKVEAARRVEEQKIAREEERKRMLMEEERRKEAARKKLLELEAKMAQRKTGGSGDEQVIGKGRDGQKVASDVGDWEDGERMVEHITNTASSESQSNYFETGSSRIHPQVNGNTSFVEREQANYWKRDAYDYGSSSMFNLPDQEGDFYSSKRDDFSSGRPFSKKDKFGGFPSASARPSSRGRTSEYSSVSDDFRYSRGNRWDAGGDVDTTDLLDSDKFGEPAWGSGRSRGSPNALYTERAFQNEVDGGFPSFGRSRHSLRQPRVLPPPSISSMHHATSRNESDTGSSASFLDSQSRYHNTVRNEGGVMQSSYDSGYHQRNQVPRSEELVESDVIYSERKEERNSLRCDSQSSLSVSNPPSSPTHLSHDGFDEVDDNPSFQTSLVEEHTFLSDDEHIASESQVGNTNAMGTLSSVSHGEDDEWAIENNEEINEQEDYDEEDDGYNQEEEEAGHDGADGETLEFDQDFDDLQSDLANKTGKLVSDITDTFEVGINDDSLQNDNLFTQGLVSDSSKILNATEMALQELTLESVPTSTTSPLDIPEASRTRGIQQQGTSNLSAPMPSISTVQSATSTVPAVSQAEAPIRLQFGLFSGPSLIPSPVPAIQIGTIQMPLHLHPHLHPQQPPLFQFGQLRYPSPLSQGILPLGQTMSFVHPPASAQHSSSQNLGSSVHAQANQAPSSQNGEPGKVLSGPHEDQLGPLKNSLDLSQGSKNYKQQDELSNQQRGEVASRSQGHNLGYRNDRHNIHDFTARKNYRPVLHNKETQMYPGHIPSQMSNGERAQIGSRAPGIISRGRRFAYTARNANTRPLFPAPETARTDSGGFQRRPRRNARRTEFRIRENVYRGEREVMESYSNVAQDGRPNLNGKMPVSSTRYGVRKDNTKNTVESENIDTGISNTDVGNEDRPSANEAVSRKRVSSLEASQAGEGSGKGIMSFEEDIGAPLQSGVVCVYRQPGIEVPSDEDDFIEVRSKRQMLNDRREQREKEIKAKSRMVKPPRKHRMVPQSNVAPNKYKKSSFMGETRSNLRSDVITDGRGFPAGATPVFTSNMVSQTLPPIGTPATKIDSDARSSSLKANQTSFVPSTSSSASKLTPGLPFEKNNTVLVNVSLPSDSWSSSDVNQQVLALTQSQLDDAMKPGQFDSQAASSISLEPSKPSTSIMVQEKSFPSSASPINSLLAGERIQFGAVTSPTLLPPISRSVSNGIGSPGSSRLDVPKDHSLTATKTHFDKEKHADGSSTRLDDPEAEAEAAASAVAVAAITNNDEIAGNMLGDTVSDSKSFSSAENTELITSGASATVSKEVPSQSAAEESLSVALPADLSVGTPLPLWHPLPSPQGTSGPMLSHLPQPSHFPILDVNPIFGGPVFAFGSHDESVGTHAQPPRSTTLGTGQIGPWHSGVDSFYSPPTGFAAPYISPPGGLPGVQAPPHMVVYNHFAPVGQFGQVGLSFMGTTYIPTGKQPDWKHNPVSSAPVGTNEGEIASMNAASVQRNPGNMPPPMQHMAPGSSLMPMAPPLPIFDMSPFQTSADIPFQARWSHVPPPPMHSIPLTMPLQHQHQHQHQHQQHPQQADSDMPSHFARNVPHDTSTINRFNAPSSTTTDGTATQFPDELGLEGPPNVSTSNAQPTRPSYNPSTANNMKGTNGPRGSSRSNMDQRGGTSQKTGSGEWHRRSGYQGRGHSSGPDKSFGQSKMKQIYVAKRPSSGPANT